MNTLEQIHAAISIVQKLDVIPRWIDVRNLPILEDREFLGFKISFVLQESNIDTSFHHRKTIN